MCGIMGYIGKGNSLHVLVDGLKRLEYRGYDSAGLAFLNGRGLEIYKTKGKLKELVALLPVTAPTIRIGLGHTRWATHGAPSDRNAHPHCVEGIAVVHNGIIENYRELRAELEAAGQCFSSETDTEVVPQLIVRNLKQGASLREAIEDAVRRLKGSYALAIMSSAFPDALFVVRKGSPLVIGIGKGEYFCASDIPALLPYTRTVIFLEEGQLCVMTAEGLELSNYELKVLIPVEDKRITIDWTPAMAEKDGHDHFMHKEIHEQPRAILNTLREWIHDPGDLLRRLDLSKKIPDVRRIHIVACGTSYHAGLVGKYLIERLARIRTTVELASEYRYGEPLSETDTLFISITQSGETADTLAALREAKLHGARTLTICNVVGSSSSREAGSVLYTRGGPEIGVASTKAFTAQIAALFVLGLALGRENKTLSSDEALSLTAALHDIPARIREACALDSEVKALARTILNARSALYLGRGINYPIALEGALKLKEISYIHAEGYAAGEMKHGPIALIEEGLPVVVVAPMNDLFEKTLSNIEEVNARGGRVIAITDAPGALKNKAADILAIPCTHQLLAPFVTVVPLQLLAYHTGVLRGCDVDQPRNLAKSVTVE